jgi:hypothetical protein
MSAKKSSEINAVNGQVNQISIVQQLQNELVQAEKNASGSEKIVAELNAAKAQVTLLSSQLKGFSEARARVAQLRNAIRSLTGPVGGGVVMSAETKLKLSETHKRLWAQKKAAKAGGATIAQS